jgi:hypothetical protein
VSAACATRGETCSVEDEPNGEDEARARLWVAPFEHSKPRPTGPPRDQKFLSPFRQKATATHSGTRRANYCLPRVAFPTRASGPVHGDASEGRCSSAELSGYDVIDELCVARAQSGPAFAVDNEPGEHTGRKLFLELRQVGTPRCEDEREVV